MAPTRTRISLTALMLAAALAACSDANDPGDRRVSTVEVTPDALLLEAIGATGQLTATAKDISGNRIPGHTPEWTNPNGSDPGVTVSETGLVTAVREGTELIVATIQGVSDTATVTVALPE
jgi:uncharacterized protein YjdB